jgi:hypothetical protein
MTQDQGERRRPTLGSVPDADDGAWLRLSDEELLHRIEQLPNQHLEDHRLLEIVRSSRHFFIRQMAAKRLQSHESLKGHAHDRHVGQILARMMTREEDVAYLERLRDETKYLDVRNAADASLKHIARSRHRR